MSAPLHYRRRMRGPPYKGVNTFLWGTSTSQEKNTTHTTTSSQDATSIIIRHRTARIVSSRRTYVADVSSHRARCAFVYVHTYIIVHEQMRCASSTTSQENIAIVAPTIHPHTSRHARPMKHRDNHTTTAYTSCKSHPLTDSHCLN